MKRTATFLTLAIMAIAVYAQSARVNNTWIEHRPDGLRIHVNMDAWNLQGSPVEVICFFWFDDGRMVKSTDGQYQAPNRQVCTSTTVYPPYQSTNWSDLKLWIPMSQIKDKVGTRYFKCRVEVFNYHNFLAKGNYVNFWINKSR